MFKVIVAGSREFDDYELLTSKLDKILFNIKDSIEIVSGTADGADKLGERYAQDRSYLIKRMPANWKLYNKSAGYIRNEEMAKYAAPDGACIVFWVNKSKGSGHMIDLARKYNLKLRIIEL